MEPQTPQAPRTEDQPNVPAQPITPADLAPSVSQAPAAPQVLQPPNVQQQLESPRTIGSVVGPTEVASPLIPSAPIAQKTPKKKKWLIAGLVVLIIIILGGASAAAYVGYFMPRQPKYVLARALGNSVSKDVIKSAHYEGDFAVKDAKENQTFKGNFNGGVSDTAFAFNGSVGLQVTTLKFDVRAFKNSSGYVKIDGLKGLPELLKQDSSMAAMYAPIISSINNQWIELDQSLLANLGQKGLSASYQVSDEDAAKIEKMYRENPFLEVTKVHSDEEIHGVKSHHYTVTINRDKLYNFGQDLKGADIKNFPEISQSDLNQIKKAQFSKYPVDVWIDTADTVINQIAFTAKEDDTELSLRMAYTDVNKSVNISKPTNAKTLMEVLSENSDTMHTMDMSSLLSGDMSTGATSTRLNTLTN